MFNKCNTTQLENSNESSTNNIPIEIVNPKSGDTLLYENQVKLIVKYDDNQVNTPLRSNFSLDEGKTWQPMSVKSISGQFRNDPDYRYEVLVWKPYEDSVTSGYLWLKVADYGNPDAFNHLVKSVFIQ